MGDWYFYVRVLEDGKIAYNRKSLNRFRVHGGSVTGKSKNGRKHYNEVLQIHNWLREEYTLNNRVVEAIRMEEARIKEKQG